MQVFMREQERHVKLASRSPASHCAVPCPGQGAKARLRHQVRGARPLLRHRVRHRYSLAEVPASHLSILPWLLSVTCRATCQSYQHVGLRQLPSASRTELAGPTCRAVSCGPVSLPTFCVRCVSVSPVSAADVHGRLPASPASSTLQWRISRCSCLPSCLCSALRQGQRLPNALKTGPCACSHAYGGGSGVLAGSQARALWPAPEAAGCCGGDWVSTPACMLGIWLVALPLHCRDWTAGLCYLLSDLTSLLIYQGSCADPCLHVVKALYLISKRLPPASLHVLPHQSRLLNRASEQHGIMVQIRMPTCQIAAVSECMALMPLQ